MRTGRGDFATSPCRTSTTSTRWPAISCAMRPMPRTRCRNAICGRCATSIRSAAGDIKPWLFAILRNVCRATYARATLDLVEEIDDRSKSVWQEDTGTPETAALRQHDDATVRRLVAELPAQFREVIVLREINDLSYREIADIARAPVGTVMSRLARARAMLRTAWNAAKAAEGTEMTCEETEILLHALADGELDAGNARAIEAHVATCTNCAQRLRDIRDIREALAGRALQFAAPASLRAKIEASLPAPAPRIAGPSRRSLLQGFALGTALSNKRDAKYRKNFKNFFKQAPPNLKCILLYFTIYMLGETKKAVLRNLESPSLGKSSIRKTAG